MTPLMGRYRIIAMILVGLAVVGLGVGLLMGSGSECATDSNCAPGQQCMIVTHPNPSGLEMFFAQRVCRIPCHSDSDCPAGHECWMVDHGPGPGPFCMKASPPSR